MFVARVTVMIERCDAPGVNVMRRPSGSVMPTLPATLEPL